MNESSLFGYNMMIAISQMQLWWARVMMLGGVRLPEYPEPNDLHVVGQHNRTADGLETHFGIVIKTWRN